MAVGEEGLESIGGVQEGCSGVARGSGAHEE